MGLVEICVHAALCMDDSFVFATRNLRPYLAAFNILGIIKNYSLLLKKK